MVEKREDYLLASGSNPEDQKVIYSDLHSGAESGWDFSTRWFVTSTGSNEGTIGDIKTKQIIPVDLNAYLCMNSRLLSDLYNFLGDSVKTAQYQQQFTEWKEAVRNVSLQRIAYCAGQLKFTANFRSFGTRPKVAGLIMTSLITSIAITSTART